MRNWLFEPEHLENTPSRRNGIDAETEQRYRIEGVKLILDVGQALKLDPHPTLATAGVYFHRFYMNHSFKEFNRYITALSCLFLAGKVEETPKKCKDILSAAREKFSDDAWARIAKYPSEDLMAIERVLLQTVKFDLVVHHPYEFVLKYAKIFNRKNQIHQVVQAAWTFVNDSLCTELCLLYEPEVIAIALLYLASRFSKVALSDWNGRRGDEKWYDQFVENLDKQTIEAICHTVLDFYSATNQLGAQNAAAASTSNKQSPSSSGSTPRTPGPPPQPPTTSSSAHKSGARSSTSSAQSNSARLPSASAPGAKPVAGSSASVLAARGAQHGMSSVPPPPTTTFGSAHPHPAQPMHPQQQQYAHHPQQPPPQHAMHPHYSGGGYPPGPAVPHGVPAQSKHQQQARW